MTESSHEIECKYRVSCLPSAIGEGRLLRQAYVAIEHPVSVRVRDDARDGCMITIKAGKGAVRHEIELPIDRQQFDVLWRLAGNRSVEKTRYEIDHDGHMVEIDVFHGRHDGLIVAEVEFDSLAALDAFRPPPWFGEDLTDDMRFTNAALALEAGSPPA